MRGTAMKRFARETANLLIHFAHGGLLAAGILVTVILIVRIGMVQNQAPGFQGIGSLIGGERAQPFQKGWERPASYKCNSYIITINY